MKLTIIDHITDIDSPAKKISMEVDSSMSILQLRMELYEKMGILGEIGLEGKYIAFKNDKSLEACEIREESKLIVLWIKIPEEIRCPISGSIFLDPVLLPCGTTVERQVIEKYILSEGISPFNRQTLTLEDLKSDVVTQAKVNNYFDSEKNNPFITAIRERNQYKIEIESQKIEEPRGPEDPSPDDLAAMGQESSSESSSEDYFGAIAPALRRPPFRISRINALLREMSHTMDEVISNDSQQTNPNYSSDDDLYGPSVEENLRGIFNRVTAPTPLHSFFAPPGLGRLFNTTQEQIRRQTRLVVEENRQSYRVPPVLPVFRTFQDYLNDFNRNNGEESSNPEANSPGPLR